MIEEIDLSEDIVFDDIPDREAEIPYEQEIFIDTVPDVGADLPDSDQANSGDDSEIDDQSGSLADNVEINYTELLQVISDDMSIIRQNQKIIGDNINLFGSVSIGIFCMLLGGIVMYMFIGKIR